MSSTNQNAKIDSEIAQIARANAYPHLQPGFAAFVADARARCERRQDPSGGEFDVWDFREVEGRHELLNQLHTMFQAGHDEPVSEFELIGFVWLYVADRCDSPLLVTAEKLWLDFEEWLPGCARRRAFASTI